MVVLVLNIDKSLEKLVMISSQLRQSQILKK